MVTLKVAIDASGAVQGAQQVNQAVEQIGRTTDQTAQKIDTIGRRVSETMPKAAADTLKLNRAIETVGEVTQVGSRVRLLGEEIRNIGSSASSASTAVGALGGLLFDVAQISEKTGGNMAALAGVLRANPILAAAGVFSLIASAMSLFGNETRDTNKELSEQVKLQRQLADVSVELGQKLQRLQDLQAAGFEVDAGAQQRLRAEQLVNAATGLANRPGTISRFELAGLAGGQDALSRAQQISGVTGNQSSGGLGLFGSFSTEDARKILLALASELRRESETIIEQEVVRKAQEIRPPAAGTVADASLFPTVGVYGGIGADRPYGPQLPTAGVGYFNGPIGPMPGEESPFSRVTRMNEIQDAERQLAEFNDRLAQTRQLGLDVGNALGNSFFAFLQNANNARGVLVGLLQQLSAIAQQRIVSGFANGVANLFAPTPTQATTNPNMTGFGPQPAPGFQS